MARRHVNLDEVLDQLGHFGRYQCRLYALILLPILFSAVYNAQYVFNAADVDYRCVVPECESPPYQFTPGEWGEWALEPGAQQCRRRRSAADSCERALFTGFTQPCRAWVYRTHDSIVAEFDLACQDWKRTLVGTVHSLGVFFALLTVGVISDSMGRRNTLILTSSAVAAVGLVRSFATSYAIYITLEFIDALVGAGVYSTGFVLALEMVGKEMRVLGGACMSGTFALGQVLLALVAWAIPNWRHLTRVLYAPSFFFIFYFFFLEESVRWLLSKGKKEKASRVLQKVAKVNRREVSMNTLVKLESEADFQKHEIHREGRQSLCKQVLHSRSLLTRVAVCSFCWVTVTFVYYGLSINSVSLAGNMYVNYILTSLVEIPGVIASVLTLDRFGRKRSIMTAFFICGFSLLGLPFIPKNLVGVLLTLFAKMCISWAFVSIYIYTLELFPTAARHSLLNVCSTVGRVGSITAPLSPLLLKVVLWLPYLLFGCMALVAALLLLLTPETHGAALPDTVAQAEELGPSSPPPAAAAPSPAPPPASSSHLPPEPAPSASAPLVTPPSTTSVATGPSSATEHADFSTNTEKTSTNPTHR